MNETRPFIDATKLIHADLIETFPDLHHVVNATTEMVFLCLISNFIDDDENVERRLDELHAGDTLSHYMFEDLVVDGSFVVSLSADDQEDLEGALDLNPNMKMTEEYRSCMNMTPQEFVLHWTAHFDAIVATLRR